MSNFRLKYSLSLLFLLLVLTSCPEENASLLNPPPVAETVTVRFLNFAGDKQPRQLALGDTKFLPETPYAEASDAVNPPFDSLNVWSLKNGNVEYEKYMMMKFTRRMTYNFVVLPSAPGDSIQREVDTLLYFTNSLTLPENTEQTYIKVINTVPDTTVSFSLMLGCPNGAPVASILPYRRVSAQRDIRSGQLPFSLLKHSGGETEILGLYQPLDPLQAKGQYTFFIYSDLSGNIKLKILDELYPGKDGFRDVPEVEDRITNIRVINFSGSPVNVDKYPADNIVSGLAPGRIDIYKAVPACASAAQDSVIVTSQDGTGSVATTSFEVLERYSVLVFDTIDSLGTGQAAGKTIIATPLFQNPDLAGKSLVRVVHAGVDMGGITLSLGAREASGNSERGFISGEVLAEALEYGEIAEPVILNAGSAPLTLFTAGNPGRLLFSSLSEFEAGKSYLIVINQDAEGKARISIISDEVESSAIEYLEQGTVVQVVNALASKENITFNLNNKITNAMLYYTGSFATVLRPGSHNIALKDGKSKSFTSEIGRETIIIIAGSGDETDILEIKGSVVETEPDLYYRRFINVSKDASELYVKRFYTDKDFLAGPIPYGGVSHYSGVELPNKVSYIFYNTLSDSLHRAEDISLTFGKTYSVIFAGTKADGGYSIIIHQQY
jgi:hypothetical protein